MFLFWLTSFVLSWLFWFFFAAKKRWREILPVSIFASWLSFGVEALIQYLYNLWSYSGPVLFPLFGNAFGIYLVVPYFFIQWLPVERTISKLVFYFFLWTGFAIIHWYLGKIEYHLWWNMMYSYLSDWLLFWIFYNYYVVMNLKKLSEK